MSVVFDRIGRSGRCCVLGAVLALAGLAASLPASAQNRGANVTIQLDQAQVMKIPDGVATLVVGNPLIADVSVQSGGMIVLTGKGYGMTNLLALDRTGAVLEQRQVQVTGPRDSNLVVVFRGVERETWSCAPKCERRITLGDSADFFNATLSQSTTRSSQAQGAGPPK